ncbi:MAG: TIGR03621 family F420-dependent LLM class oxidoreductase [Actinomycetota bacterium]
MASPTIRFGLQIATPPDDPGSLATTAKAAEDAGFDVLTVSDHVGPGSLAPLPALAVAAAATDRIHLGTMVLNNDMRNPVQLGWEVASLQQLSGGRFELGIGAGHTPQEYAATGLTLDRPVVRKRRLAESVEILSALFEGEPVDHAGEHHRVEQAQVPPVTRPPILVGGNGSALLRHAASHADAIGLQGLGRTQPDGFRHDVRWTIGHLEDQLATIAAAAGQRRPELAALVQAAELTDDRDKAIDALLERVPTLAREDADATPYLAFGTVDELAAQFIESRNRWGLSYFTVRSLDLAPVVARVRELEGAAEA